MTTQNTLHSINIDNYRNHVYSSYMSNKRDQDINVINHTCFIPILR